MYLPKCGKSTRRAHALDEANGEGDEKEGGLEYCYSRLTTKRVSARLQLLK